MMVSGNFRLMIARYAGFSPGKIELDWPHQDSSVMLVSFALGMLCEPAACDNIS